jgi:hypothetical protein
MVLKTRDLPNCFIPDYMLDPTERQLRNPVCIQPSCLWKIGQQTRNIQKRKFRNEAFPFLYVYMGMVICETVKTGCIILQ